MSIDLCKNDYIPGYEVWVHYGAFYYDVWCDVNFSYTMFVCIVASRRTSNRGPRYTTGGKY
jgi:hypothetical protein